MAMSCMIYIKNLKKKFNKKIIDEEYYLVTIHREENSNKNFE